MNPANLTAAERDTILAALREYRVDHDLRLEVGQLVMIDRLCERLSAPVALSETGIKSEFQDSVRAVSDTQPPQAPEPVNAELLAALKRASRLLAETSSPDTRWESSGMVEIRQAIARAEAALAAQKGQP